MLETHLWENILYELEAKIHYCVLYKMAVQYDISAGHRIP